MTLESATEMLYTAYLRGRMAHAFLFVGATRGDAGELANRLCLRLACKQADTQTAQPCGACNACRQALARQWPDAHWVEPELKSRRIGIDPMRALIRRMHQTSLTGGWKAGIVLDADRLSDEAANAFLKTLEEPPEQTVLILLSANPQSLLPTILSRCQRVDLGSDETPLPEPWRGRLLTLLSAEDAEDGPLAALGRATALEALLGEINEEARRTVTEEASKASAGGETQERETLDARIASRYREGRALVIRGLMQWYRDVLILRAGGSPDVLDYPEYAERLRQFSARLTLPRALTNIDGVETLYRQLERSLPESTVLAYWMDRMR